MKPLIYNPANGYPMRKVEGKYWDAQDYRNAYPNALWRFDPWNGVGRDFEQDPYGLALPDEDGIYNPTEEKTEATPADFAPGTRLVSNPIIKHLRFDIAVAETSVEVISLLSAVMAMYPKITNTERGAVVSWFCERYRS